MLGMKGGQNYVKFVEFEKMLIFTEFFKFGVGNGDINVGLVNLTKKKFC